MHMLMLIHVVVVHIILMLQSLRINNRIILAFKNEIRLIVIIH